jgi:hypothetical protein
MSDMDRFETRLTTWMETRADLAARPFDAVAVAHAAATGPRGRRRAWDIVGAWSPAPRFARVLIVALLVALLAAGAILVGSQLITPSPALPIPADRGAFTPTGSMAMGREGGTATLLADGRVLVTGGYGDNVGGANNAELWDPVTGTFSPAGWDTMLAFQTATLLPDGRVLVTGGRDNMGRARPHASVWDPATMAFADTGSPANGRFGARATRLADGRVLVVGDFYDDSFAPEVWDPNTDGWSPADSLPEASYPTGTVLADGRILVISEVDGSASTWDPVTQRSTPAGSLAQVRGGFTATRLLDGRVLVSGGSLIGPTQCLLDTDVIPHGWCKGGSVNPGNFLATAEIWDPDSLTFSPTGSLGLARFHHAATVLRDGRVLVLGNDGGGGESAELFELK